MPPMLTADPNDIDDDGQRTQLTTANPVAVAEQMNGIDRPKILQQPTVYDPNSPTPYQPVSTQQVIPQPFQPPPEDQIPNLGAVGHAGAIAYIGDKLLRGYMAGSAQKQIRDAVNLQRQQSAAAALYDTADQRATAMKNAGADKTTPEEFQQALDQAHTAWKGLTDIWDQHVQKMTTDPKTGKPVPAKGNILQRMFNHQDPMQVAPAWVEAMKTNGPPIDHKLAQMDTPAYQAKIAARGQQQGLGTQAGVMGAQTGVTQADIAAQRAQIQQQYLQLSRLPNPTPDQAAQRDQLYNTMLGLPNDKGAITPVGMKNISWKPLAGPQQIQKVPTAPSEPEQYGFMMVNGLGKTEVRPIEGLQPSILDQKGIMQYQPDPQTGVWTQYAKDRFGNEVPGSRRPAPFAGRVQSVSSSTADNAGNTSTTKRTTSTAPPAISGAGAGGQPPAAPAAPANLTGTSNPPAEEGQPQPQPVAAGQQPQQPRPAGQPTATPTAAAAPRVGPGSATSPASTGAGLPPHAQPATLPPTANPAGPKLNYPGALPLNAAGSPTPSVKPSDVGWEPNPNDPAQVWANNLYMHSDKYKPSDVPSQPKYLKNAVQQFMSANGMVMGDQDTMAERQMVHSMKDGYPKINEAIGLLEQKLGITPDMSEADKDRIAQEQGGLNPTGVMNNLKQRGEAKAYLAGFVPGGEDFGRLESNINQITALDSLVATTPWTKIGRSNKVFNQIQQHVPNFQTDSPGAMYNKLREIRNIFDTNIGEYNKRHNQPTPGQQSAQPSRSTQPQAQQPATPPAPQTHDWSSSGWLSTHPSGDVNAATAAAKQQGFNVVK